MDLPGRFIRPQPRSIPPAAGLLAALGIGLVCLLLLLEPAGSPLRRLRVPEDVPGFGFGLGGTYILPDGTWVIKRIGYLDGKGKYEITPAGELIKHEERSAAQEENRTGALSSSFGRMGRFTRIQVRPNRAFFAEMKKLRDDAVRSGKVEGASRPALSEPGALARAESQPEPVLLGPPAAARDFVDVNVMQIRPAERGGPLPAQMQGVADYRFEALSGHRFYWVVDAAAYRYPDLYVITDAGKHLHHLQVTEDGDRIDLQELGSVRLELPFKPVQNMNIGVDPDSGHLFILAYTGLLLWFDPQTLALLETRQLEGNWEREYGALVMPGTRRMEFPSYPNQGQRIAFSERQFKSIQGALVAALLGALLYILYNWKLPWKYISEATTAVSRSKRSSSNT